MPIYEEQAELQKQARVREEVQEFHKRQCRSSKLFRAPRAMSTWRSNNKETLLTFRGNAGDANYNTTDDTDRANP